MILSAVQSENHSGTISKSARLFPFFSSYSTSVNRKFKSQERYSADEGMEHWLLSGSGLEIKGGGGGAVLKAPVLFREPRYDHLYYEKSWDPRRRNRLTRKSKETEGPKGSKAYIASQNSKYDFRPSTVLQAVDFDMFIK
jgi:hypothetical protein